MKLYGTRLAVIAFCGAIMGIGWSPVAKAQSTGSGGGAFSVQPMFVPVMTTNGQTSPVNPYAALANPYYSPYGMGMTNQQLGLMMLTTPGRTGGIGSGQLSGVRPNPNQMGGKSPQPSRTAEVDKSQSPVKRATRPAGSATRYFTRHSPALTSQPRGRFNRQSGYFP